MALLPANVACHVAWLLVLLFALNALGWASHVDVPAPGGAGMGQTHAEITAFDMAEQRLGSGTEQHNDHCGHAGAHLIGLDSEQTLLLAELEAAAPESGSRSYASIVHFPPIDPPIV